MPPLFAEHLYTYIVVSPAQRSGTKVIKGVQLHFVPPIINDITAIHQSRLLSRVKVYLLISTVQRREEKPLEKKRKNTKSQVAASLLCC